MAKSEGLSSSARSSYKKKFGGPLCYWKKRMSTAKAWTDDNPGRRFWLCDSHGFVNWVDKEEQNECVMDRQRGEIKNLKQLLRTTSQEAPAGDSTALLLEEGNRLAEEKEKLEIALITSVEKEKLLRQFIGLSCGGFIVIIIIMAVIMVKK
ncbi:uncharacterized protein LOC106393319 [Brassica napus]|uniref:uncharacterized protein LOC106393319 n=1 Tax=Brassica napus TaxID=3708 RepID=UPI0006AAB40E|nr:uncharacterized protein LOC106393319 [Brassica napus]